MGFFEGLGKMLQGKPVFDAADDKRKGVPMTIYSKQATNEFTDGEGHKIIPEITMGRCRSHINGDKMEVAVWATNASSLEVELMDMHLIGQKTVIKRRLRPGEGHEIKAYHGNVQKDDSQHRADLEYKIVNNGDYFRSFYRIEYNREANGTFTVEDFHPEKTVKDI